MSPLAQSLPELNVRRLTWEHGPWPMQGGRSRQTGGVIKMGMKGYCPKSDLLSLMAQISPDASPFPGQPLETLH